MCAHVCYVCERECVPCAGGFSSLIPGTGPSAGGGAFAFPSCLLSFGSSMSNSHLPQRENLTFTVTNAGGNQPSRLLSVPERVCGGDSWIPG